MRRAAARMLSAFGVVIMAFLRQGSGAAH